MVELRKEKRPRKMINAGKKDANTQTPSSNSPMPSRVRSPSPIKKKNKPSSRSELYGGPRSSAIPMPSFENDKDSSKFENIPKLEPKCCDNFANRNIIERNHAARSMSPDNPTSSNSKSPKKNFLKRKLSSLKMCHKTFILSHVTDNTFSANVLIKTMKGNTAIYIPVHKKVLSNNLTYFKMLFDESSNWKNLEIDKESGCKIIDGNFAPAKILIKYLKSIYDQKYLEPTHNDAFQLFELADYFQDTKEIENLIKFIPSIISVHNFTKLMEQPFARNFKNDLIQLLTDASYLHENIDFKKDNSYARSDLCDNFLFRYNGNDSFS